MNVKSIIVRVNPPMEKPQRAVVRHGELVGDCKVETIAAALAGAPCEVVVVSGSGARHRFVFHDGQIQHGDLELYEKLHVSGLLGEVVQDPAKHEDPVGNEIAQDEADQAERDFDNAEEGWDDESDET